MPPLSTQMTCISVRIFTTTLPSLRSHAHPLCAVYQPRSQTDGAAAAAIAAAQINESISATVLSKQL